MRTLWVVVNLTVMLAFLTMASMVTFAPQHLAAMHLSRLDGQVVVMELISLLMLLAFMHRHVTRGWRWFTLAGSFLILGESILMSGLFVKQSMHDDIEQILIPAERIASKVTELATRINADYRGQELLLVSVLKGSMFFAADLMRAIKVPLVLDFMAISSYGESTSSSGVVRILKDLEEPVAGRHVLVVEDIVDTGLTLSYLLKTLRLRQPASLRLCTLVDKPARRKVPIEVEYRGFEIDDRFVVGYGLDYAQRYRHLPYIGVLRPDRVAPVAAPAAAAQGLS